MTLSLKVAFLRQLGTGLSLWRAELNPRLVRVEYLVDKVGQRQVYLQVLQFSPASIIPSSHHYQLHLNATLYQNDKHVKLGNIKESNAL
jgi:hypothetical protein